MLYLRAINLEDFEEEYKAHQQIPVDENGFENHDFGVSKEEFREKVIPRRMAWAEGRELPEGFVPATLFYLWDGDHIVGQFDVRHRLNDALRERGGHIGFCILKPYRGQHLATKGLALLIEKARDLVEEDYLLMSAFKTNVPSLRAQFANGAKIVAEKDDYYLTRIDFDGEAMPLLFEIDAKNYDPAGEAYVRNSARCIAMREGKVAMVHSLKYDYYKFPGGGIEEGETEEEAVVRETKEEAGLTVIPESIRPFGYVHRVQKTLDPDVGAEIFVQDNFYYFCEVAEEVGSQELDDYEADEKFTLEWVYPEVAIAANLRKEHGPKDLNMITREARVLALLVARGW